MVAPTSLIDVIYSADSVANKSLTLVLAEKPVAVPLALSTTLDSPGGVGLGGTAKANPPVLEEVKDGKLVYYVSVVEDINISLSTIIISYTSKSSSRFIFIISSYYSTSNRA
jgi:hypothetical protein